jgi:hypothetical protein
MYGQFKFILNTDVMLLCLNLYLFAPSDPHLTMDCALHPDYMLGISLTTSLSEKFHPISATV